MYNYFMPVKVFVGKDCIQHNKIEFTKYGNKAVIVTGKASGKKSGALDIIVNILDEYNISFCIFDRVKNNPSLENVQEAADFAIKNGAQFVIGIGGGSPLDAAKAVAVLATNRITPEELYNNKYDNLPLPIIAVPTTAGTGSEVTPFSILTYDKIKTKKSFANENIFPKCAFLDATFTEKLPDSVAVDTAVDALSHAIEGYTSKFINPVSDFIALEAIRLFSKNSYNLVNRNFDFNTRQELLEMAMLGGIVITHSKTTLIHAMGYTLTYFNNVPHGRANGLLMSEYLKYNYSHCKEKIDNILDIFNLDFEGFDDLIKNILKDNNYFNKDDILKYCEVAIQSSSLKRNPKNISFEEMKEFFENSLLK